VLYCPVPTLSWTPSSIAIQYYDDSDAPGDHVTAQFIEMQLTPSTSTGFINSVATVDSDPGTTTGGNAKGHIKEFVHAYDPKFNVYYIRVDVSRTNTNANETIYAVVLQD
jgi:hypothetical protein